MIARFVNDEENGFRFEGQWKKAWIYKRPAWIAIREWIHILFRPKLLIRLNNIFINTLALNVIQVLTVGTFFNLAKLNTDPCMVKLLLSLLDSK